MDKTKKIRESSSSSAVAAAAAAMSSKRVSDGTEKTPEPPKLAPLPRIFVLDIDGTMIGNITPQLCEYSLLMTYQKSKMKALKAIVVGHLKEGAMRPGLTDFLENVRKSSDVEVFVYTASDDVWAKFIVPCIEEATGFRFNRPLFTRKHCTQVGKGASLDYRKSLTSVSSHIQRALKTKHKVSYKLDDIVQNSILIDNKPDVLADHDKESHRLVTVPTYNATFYYDVLSNIEPPVLTKNMGRISNTLACHGMFPTISDISDTRLAPFYIDFFTSLRGCMVESFQESERLWKNDNLWSVLALTMSQKVKSHRFSSKVVSLLNSRVQKRVSTEEAPRKSPLATASVSHSRLRDMRKKK